MYFLKTKKRTKVEKADNNFPDCYNDFTISIFFFILISVFLRMDNAIRETNHYLLNSASLGA